jgi:hypothetical protein
MAIQDWSLGMVWQTAVSKFWLATGALAVGSLFACGVEGESEKEHQGARAETLEIAPPDVEQQLIARFDTQYLPLAPAKLNAMTKAFNDDLIGHEYHTVYPDALGAMYWATKDAKYAEQLHAFVEVIRAKRDDKMNRGSFDSSTPRPVWGSKLGAANWNGTQRIADIEGSAFELNILAQLYFFLSQDPSLLAGLPTPPPADYQNRLGRDIYESLAYFRRPGGNFSTGPVAYYNTVGTPIGYYTRPTSYASLACPQQTATETDAELRKRVACERLREGAGLPFAFNLELRAATVDALYAAARPSAGANGVVQRLFNYYWATGLPTDKNTPAGVATYFARERRLSQSAAQYKEDTGHFHHHVAFALWTHFAFQPVSGTSVFSRDLIERIGRAVSHLSAKEINGRVQLTWWIDGSSNTPIGGSAQRLCGLAGVNDVVRDLCWDVVTADEHNEATIAYTLLGLKQFH